MNGTMALLLACGLSCVGLAVDAHAARPLPDSERFNLFPACEEEELSYPADTAIFILHGWGLGEWTGPSGGDDAVRTGLDRLVGMARGTSFDFCIDGEEVHLVRRMVMTEGGEKRKQFVAEFPDGLPSGTYWFEGHWSLDSSSSEEDLRPGEPLLLLMCGAWVHFG